MANSSGRRLQYNTSRTNIDDEGLELPVMLYFSNDEHSYVSKKKKAAESCNTCGKCVTSTARIIFRADEGYNFSNHGQYSSYLFKLKSVSFFLFWLGPKGFRICLRIVKPGMTEFWRNAAWVCVWCHRLNHSIGMGANVMLSHILGMCSFGNKVTWYGVGLLCKKPF